MYTQITQAQLAQEILVALQDPSGIFWPLEEVNSAINEALLYWGALTSYWRERGSFTTGIGTPFYDLSVQLPTLRARTYTFDQLTKEVQWALNEQAAGVSGAGMTSQFAIVQFLNALSRRRNQFVLDARLPYTFDSGAFWDSGIVWDQSGITWDQSQGAPISPPPSGRTALPDYIALIGRALWTEALSGKTHVLRREDGWSEDSYNPNWTLEPSIPFAYSAAETRPDEIQFYPPPAASGAIGLVYVRTKVLDSRVGNTTFAIPDEFSCALKYGALYSILSTQNEGFDPFLAKYALERYTAAIEASKAMRSILRIQINDKPTALDTLANLDSARPYWQNKRGKPDMAGTIYDIVGLADVPNGLFGATCDIVRSAPLPQNPGEDIQVGSEEIGYIMDYCRHILSFKLGGSEFQATFALHDNFLAGAAQRNKLLGAKARYLTALFGQDAKQEGIFNAA